MADIERKRGDTYPINYQVLSATTGLALDISGASFLLTVDPDDKPVNSDNNLFQLVGNITDAPNGLVDFPVSAGQSDNLGFYYHDIQMTDSSGFIRTIDAGKFVFKEDITK